MIWMTRIVIVNLLRFSKVVWYGMTADRLLLGMTPA